MFGDDYSSGYQEIPASDLFLTESSVACYWVLLINDGRYRRSYNNDNRKVFMETYMNKLFVYVSNFIVIS